MSRKVFLFFLLATASIAPVAGAYSKGEDPYVFSLDDAATSGAVSRLDPTPGEILAGVLTLFGFLGLIASNLMRWSTDVSWKERSVFQSSSPEAGRRSSRTAGS